MLDKDSPIPLYVQFKDYLLTQIRQGEYKNGDRLPSTREFVEQFGVSRPTIRSALRDLERDGVLVAVVGKGTFVSSHLEHQADGSDKAAEDAFVIGPEYEEDFHPLSSFSEQMDNLGLATRSDVLRCEVTKSTKTLSEQLLLPVNSNVIWVARLRYVERKPWVWQETFLPMDTCSALLRFDLSVHSIYRVLRQECGLVPLDSVNRYEARLASAEERDRLGLKNPAAVLVMRQTSYLKNGKPFEYTKSVYAPNLTFVSRHSRLDSDQNKEARY